MSTPVPAMGGNCMTRQVRGASMLYSQMIQQMHKTCFPHTIGRGVNKAKRRSRVDTCAWKGII